jgi:hypothetical protein
MNNFYSLHYWRKGRRIIMSWNPNQGQNPNQPDGYSSYGGYQPPPQPAQGTDPYSQQRTSGQTGYGQQPYGSPQQPNTAPPYGSSQQPNIVPPYGAPNPYGSSSAILDTLKQKENLGYVVAGAAAIIGFIAFFLPYVTVSFLGVTESVGGSSGGVLLWIEEICALLVAVISGLLLFRKNAFGLTTMPVAKQVRTGRIVMIVGAVIALLIQLLFLLVYQAEVGAAYGSVVSLGFGFWLFLLAAIAMIIGGTLALRSPSAPAVVPTYGQNPYQPTPYSTNQPPAPPTQYPPYQPPPQNPPQQW